MMGLEDYFSFWDAKSDLGFFSSSFSRKKIIPGSLAPQYHGVANF